MSKDTKVRLYNLRGPYALPVVSARRVSELRTPGQARNEAPSPDLTNEVPPAVTLAGVMVDL